MDPWGDDARWYPDIVEAGDASEAWRAEFERQGVTFDVQPDGDLSRHRRAGVSSGELRADLTARRGQRQFYLALRTGRFTALQGFAPDLAVAAQAARMWLAGTRPGEVAAAFPFLGSVALAEARERGDRAESRWLWLYENHCDDPIGAKLRAFVALAFHEPRLRQPQPFTSHFTLGFGRDHPVVTPASTADRFVVRTRDGHVHEETDAPGALRLVLADLPPT
ncbi:DUF6193 family natural product biosynthesis protein [Actinoplanes sp. NBC_00393]|uniref:DUF6193 family natural product biosynthesis protein n=1 Tax=Actinoplanes sp. NBC_00393 TaxID=2975953 RepID=UPI002E2099C0